MDHYEIIMTTDSINDLSELRNYIADVLLARETALKLIRQIRDEISKLSELPGRIKPMEDEPWKSRGIRRLICKNFYIYYRIDEAAKRVYVLNVIYARRDQLNALGEKQN